MDSWAHFLKALRKVRCVVMPRKTMRSSVMSHGGQTLLHVTPMMVPDSVAGSIMSAASKSMRRRCSRSGWRLGKLSSTCGGEH